MPGTPHGPESGAGAPEGGGPAARESRSGKATLRDVAERAGVSAMTASRVLRDDPRVHPATRDRVRAAAAALGYRPNELARRLRLGRGTGLVGLVVTNLANPFYSRLALGVDAVLAPDGLKTVIGNTRQDLDAERDLVADLVGRRVDGIIAVPAGDDQRHLAAAAAEGVPVVLASRPPEGFAADCVLVDDFGGARDATARLIARGHRRIGFLGSPPAVYTGTERLRGYRSALAAAGLPADERYVRQGQTQPHQAERAAAALLRLPDPPTALFCSNNRNTIGAFRALRATRSAAALAGFDDFELADALGLPLTLVAYDSDELGREAGRLLRARTRAHDPATGPPPSTRRVVLATELVEYGG
ncbi:LacI family DNA-binding transcriptional regulator [Streptomyces spectabilis]|uniref:LacI family transcriptional regulator n=1 Tax=Streptomyces spectabilis TaxID=68270 RepID=A0A5P2WZB2_STRST|nr:LacI family DNA-binding transcriptional regulator [Streptomyces spectabilis]MBB5101347.1 LacI family transcriptional regulator [Streptomyces spectabilis]QEV58113.1 LacI family transcriptional regulator [Streptomyces spectabilis]GGV10828.1 LacI family transcriptional regulator [Streptomyces spectabilis]